MEQALSILKILKEIFEIAEQVATTGDSVLFFFDS